MLQQVGGKKTGGWKTWRRTLEQEVSDVNVEWNVIKEMAQKKFVGDNFLLPYALQGMKCLISSMYPSFFDLKSNRAMSEKP